MAGGSWTHRPRNRQACPLSLGTSVIHARTHYLIFGIMYSGCCGGYSDNMRQTFWDAHAPPRLLKVGTVIHLKHYERLQGIGLITDFHKLLRFNRICYSFCFFIGGRDLRERGNETQIIHPSMILNRYNYV